MERQQGNNEEKEEPRLEMSLCARNQENSTGTFEGKQGIWSDLPYMACILEIRQCGQEGI